MLNWRPNSLRHGFVLIVIAALLPIVVVSLIQGFATLENTRNLAASRLNANAKAVAEHLRDPFVIAQHLLMTLAQNPEVRTMSGGCDAALAAGLRNYKPLVNFGRADANGLMRCSVRPFAEGTSVAQENWWKRGIALDKLTITRPVFANVSKREVLILMLPLRTEAEQPNGALMTGIDINNLEQAIAQTPEARSGLVAVVSADGNLVTGGNKTLPFKPDLSIPSAKAQLSKGADGQTWMYSLAKLYSSDLYVVYAEPRDALMQAAIWQIRSSVLLPIISILLASLAIAFGAHLLVVRWLRDLGAIADRFSHGDFTGDRLKFADAPREIAELSSDLHAMAEVIDHRNRDLQQALDAKTELSREVHHRVKNNLQIITSLLTLQASRLKESRPKEVLGQTRARISALALIHRLLYEQDGEKEHGSFAMNSLLEELCAQLRSANVDRPNVQLHCTASTHPIAIDHAVPLALFVVEAVTNAYRHAFSSTDAGLIEVIFSTEANKAVLEVADNGSGFDESHQQGQMGTELMNAFAVQVGGELAIESTSGNGTVVMLTLPLT